MLDSQITFEAARMNAGLTLKEAARRLNVNARTVKRWEAYKAAPSVDHFVGLCRLYGCSVDAIKL